jgi:hypothetical protein
LGGKQATEMVHALIVFDKAYRFIMRELGLQPTVE